MMGDKMIEMTRRDGSIVALSFGLSFIGAYWAINLCDQFRICKRETPKLLSNRAFMVLMAISIGGVSMWVMHFVAMYSVNWKSPEGIELEIRYRKDYTLISLIVPTICCYLGIFFCSKDKAFIEEKKDVLGEFVKRAEKMSIKEIRKIKSSKYVLYIALFRSLHRIILGGILTAVGVCIMHFVGMEAIVIDGKIEWNKGIIVSFVLIASLASIVAYWILFRLISLYPRREILRLTSALIMATAVTSMHFVGEAAATFIYMEGFAGSIPKSQTIDNYTATLGAVVASVIYISVISIITTSDLREWYYNKQDLIIQTDMVLMPLFHSVNSIDLANITQATFESYKMIHLSLRKVITTITPFGFNNVDSPITEDGTHIGLT